MNTREKLIVLIMESVNGCARNWAEVIADHLLKNGVVVIDTDVVSMKNRPLISTVASLPIDEVIDLVKAKIEGRLIVPPVKVGDTVFLVFTPKYPANPADKGKWYLYRDGVQRIICGARGLSIETWNMGTIPEKEIGKKLFFDKVEAEKALAERGRQ